MIQTEFLQLQKLYLQSPELLLHSCKKMTVYIFTKALNAFSYIYKLLKFIPDLKIQLHFGFEQNQCLLRALLFAACYLLENIFSVCKNEPDQSQSGRF